MSTIHNTVKFRDVIAEFNQIRATSASGNLVIEVSDTPSWMLCFSAGKLAGISGGIDAIERWQRNLALASLNMPLDRLVKSNDKQEVFLNSNKIAQEFAAKEVIFDIIQFSQNNGDRLSFRFIAISEKNTQLKSVLPLLDIQPILTSAIQSWQEWAKQGLALYPPSHFPAIRDREAIAKIGDKDLLSLINSIDGVRSLRSLAIYNQKQLIDAGTELLSLLASGAIVVQPKPSGAHTANKEDVATVDGVKISAPLDLGSLPLNNTDDRNAKSIPLIACIDDSISVYKNLEQIITGHGYRSYGIQDSIKIIPTLLRNKPDLIFLDLIMPVTNGYEVCEQIRKTPSLANIPIIILTGSDGLIDRVRTKFVGANGFLGKPIEASAVIKMMDKYLDRKHSSKFLNLAGKSDLDKADSINNSKRVLVVDDDRSIREVVSMCLNKLKNWEVVTAGSGREGLNSIKSKHPDAIVLDVMMPEMDGLAFLRHLRADRATKFIPVVLLTANRYLPDKELLDELGVVEIVSKPFLPIDLVRQIDRALDGNACLA